MNCSLQMSSTFYIILTCNTFSVRPDICYEFENSVKKGKNNDENGKWEILGVSYLSIQVMLEGFLLLSAVSNIEEL